MYLIASCMAVPTNQNGISYAYLKQGLESYKGEFSSAPCTGEAHGYGGRQEPVQTTATSEYQSHSSLYLVAALWTALQLPW
jgi:hypothetical protein